MTLNSPGCGAIWCGMNEVTLLHSYLQVALEEGIAPVSSGAIPQIVPDVRHGETRGEERSLVVEKRTLGCVTPEDVEKRGQ